MRRPSLKDVAKAAGVHTGTASRALNDRTASMVSPQTMERVREAADALGYRVNRVARGLKTSRSFTIGMLVPDITNPFFPPMVRGAGDGLSQAGYTLVLADTDNDPGKERLHQTLMLERQVDGLLLATARRRDDVIEELITTGLPFVLVNRTIDRGGVSAVIPDDQAGMALAVDHLHALGHRIIGHVAGPATTSTGARRAAGFEAAVRSLGVEPGPTLEAPSFTVEGGRAVAEGLLTGPARPSAIVAANDLIALGTLDVAASLGLSCPADFSLVGFNDMPFVDRLRPPLTTVRVDEHALGLRASRLLLSHIEDPEARRETIMLAPELVVRGSTAATV
ncbi:MAG: LacI family DNA-binding transcriptional regulator [Actinomycetota bacterium]